METRNPAIQTQGLTKRYGDRIAVNALDLTVYDGEIFALLGMNGAGKTTTIKMLTGLTPPSSGTATVEGHDVVRDAEAAKMLLNVSPQETAVAPKLTVRENLEFVSLLYGATRDEARTRAQEMLDLFSLADRARDRASKLSGGMQRRLSLAMALITNPKLVFLDEPTLGLDVVARRELWRVIENLRGRATVILTTHYLEEAEALSDRIAILVQGELRAIGTADELKALSGCDSIEDAFLTISGESVCTER